MEQTTLETLMENCKGKRGINHFTAMTALRKYLADITDEQFEREVRVLTTEANLGYLIQAGLSRERQGILAKIEREG